QRVKPDTYRIQTLLRTYLATDLENRQPERHRRAHSVAARWWLAADEPLHALQHAEQAADPEVLHTILRGCAVQLIATGQIAAVRRALDAAGPALAATDAWSALLAAVVAERAGAGRAAVAARDQARRIWPPD